MVVGCPCREGPTLPLCTHGVSIEAILSMLKHPPVVPAEALMPTMLVQEHKDKTITHTVHEVLAWFGQPCLRPRMRENNSTIQ